LEWNCALAVDRLKLNEAYTEIGAVTKFVMPSTHRVTSSAENVAYILSKALGSKHGKIIIYKYYLI